MFEEKKKVKSIGKMTYLELLELRVEVQNAVDRYENEALDKLNQGMKVPGFRLKKGRKTRKVANEATMVNAIVDKFGIERDALFVSKMVGIPAIETLIGTKGINKDKVAVFLTDHVITTFSDPTLNYVGA